MYTLRMAKRMLFETNKRLLWKLFWNLGVKGARSVLAHRRRMRKGQFFPPFLYVSIINSCNLRSGKSAWKSLKNARTCSRSPGTSSGTRSR